MINFKIFILAFLNGAIGFLLAMLVAAYLTWH
jgi:hypothetical protein